MTQSAKLDMWADLVINIIIVGAATVYVIGLLWISDTLLSTYLQGYIFSGNYKYGSIIFFVAALVCGKAFAAVVSSMSLRALPAVFTTPMLLYPILKSRQHSFRGY